jgi:hypothetical protein
MDAVDVIKQGRISRYVAMWGLIYVRFTLFLRLLEDIVGANISKYKCTIFGNMESPSVVDSKAGLPDIGIFYSFHLS